MAYANQQEDRRQRLIEMIAHFDHLLPGQAPIRDFVHHNTLHGYQHLKFPDALKTANELTGAYGYMSRDKFHQAFMSGRVNHQDIQAVVNNNQELEADKVIFSLDSETIRQADIYTVHLLYPLEAITKQQLTWQLDEGHSRGYFQKNIAEENRKKLLQKAQATETVSLISLWNACLDKLDIDHTAVHPEAMLDMDPESAQALFESLGGEPIPNSSILTHSDHLIRIQTRDALDKLINQLGGKLTLAGFLYQLSGINLHNQILPYLQRILSNWLDLGSAAWHIPVKSAGLYSYWKEHGHEDLSWILKRIPDFDTQLESLPDDPLDAIITELQRLGIPEKRWAGYLERLALDLPGWSGMVFWRSQKPGYKGKDISIDMADYLAVRLITEHLFARRFCREQWLLDATLPDLRGYFRRNLSEFLVRKALYSEELPEYLVTLGQQIQEKKARESYPAHEWRLLAQMIWTWQQAHDFSKKQPRKIENHGWRLFCMAQHLGLTAADIQALSAEAIDQIFACLERLDVETAGFLRLQAYEYHYREEIFAAITLNHARGSWPDRMQRPQAQVIFCMDDREEGFRRHLETINPSIETLGAAAFFGVVMNWKGLDDNQHVSLCPVVVTPEHQIIEEAVPGYESNTETHKKRFRLRTRLRDFLYNETHRNLLTSASLIILTSPLILFFLAGRTLAPRSWGKTLEKLADSFDQQVPTQVRFNAEKIDEDRSIDVNQLGFSLAEQTDIVLNFLRTNGLTKDFSKLVVMMGHYSQNQNNPHSAVYGCGACSGKYSGPNARVFAAMANNVEVRSRLAEEGINIPDDCWFLGAEHDTCNETITWQDIDKLPEEFILDFERLKDDLFLAGKHSAHERCRKLLSAPDKPGLDEALHHMQARSLDYSQARPELGHASNAVGFVGRRHMTEGVFFDRRSFLISYNASQDPDGELLERLLLSAGPVGAGINLEYYFSSVNNSLYGAGTKVTHNVVGLFGVMEGGSSDLRTGLPQQMIEIHEPMRLLLIVEAATATLTDIYQRQPAIEELVGNGWLILAAKDPGSANIHLFNPENGWNLWQADNGQLDVIIQTESWADWYSGNHDHLGPVTLKRENTHG